MTTETETGQFTIEEARAYVDAFVVELAKICEDPSTVRLLKIGEEYTPEQLQELLQRYGSYIGSLINTEKKIGADIYLLKQSYRTGMDIAMAKEVFPATVTAQRTREAFILAKDEMGAPYRTAKTLLIKEEACYQVVKGWREAYEAAYAAVSRIVSLVVGEQGMQGGQ